MTRTERAAQLAEQLQAAGNAHFVYETTELNGVYDEQWSDWYAIYLLTHDWNASFARGWNQNDLAEQLRQCHVAHRAAAPATSWIEFYAGQFAALT